MQVSLISYHLETVENAKEDKIKLPEQQKEKISNKVKDVFSQKGETINFL